MNWTSAADYEDILYELSGDGIAKITINRPEVHNAFRPETLIEVSDALEKAREDTTVGVIILTGAGDKAFCTGGDQRVRGDRGYVGEDKVPRLNILDVQNQIRYLPKPVIAHAGCPPKYAPPSNRRAPRRKAIGNGMSAG